MATTKSPRRMLSIPEPGIRVLNQDDIDKNVKISATEAAKDLQKLMLKMKGEVMAEDGSRVDYKALKKSKLYGEYKEQASGLKQLNIQSLSEGEKLAFFINIYNALTIHGIAECKDLPGSVLDIQLFWKTTAYNIGGEVFSLDDIEHGVLRGNRPHPAARELPFKSTDSRMKYVVKKRDPRIHFALACGAKSCPAIMVYTAENVDSALDAATRSYCDQEIKVFEKQRQIHISKLFQWYKVDFGNTDVDAIRWTTQYLSQEKKSGINKLLDLMDIHGMVDFHYTDYNWNLNCIT